MRSPALCSALQALTGQMQSELFNHHINQLPLTLARTKQNLKSGKTAVRGDQWPIFLYARYDYDAEDPWKGLLRSEILIFISSL